MSSIHSSHSTCRKQSPDIRPTTSPSATAAEITADSPAAALAPAPAPAPAAAASARWKARLSRPRRSRACVVW